MDISRLLLPFLMIEITIVIVFSFDCRECKINACADKETRCCKECSLQVTCLKDEIFATLPKWSGIFPLNDLSLADGHCLGRDNGTHYIFSTSIRECKTKRILLSGHQIVYKNDIRHRSGAPLYVLSCLYKQKLRRKAAIRVRANEALHHTSIDGRRRNKNIIYIEEEDYVFFEVKAPRFTRLTGSQMGVRSCSLDKFSHKSEKKIERRDEVIKNGCPTRKEVQVLQHTEESFWFSVYLQNVNPNQNETIVLNCKIMLCPYWRKTQCLPSCNH